MPLLADLDAEKKAVIDEIDVLLGTESTEQPGASSNSLEKAKVALALKSQK